MFVKDPAPGSFYVDASELCKYHLVINSAMFEHIRERFDLDAVDKLVSDAGVLMLHTVVCENVPADPNWFYLVPMVHTAFHTNKSMSVLMDQWGYRSSIYCPSAKSWFLFKSGAPGVDELEGAVDLINQELKMKFFFYSKGFMDYWKGF